MREFWMLVENKAKELKNMAASGELARLQGQHAIKEGAWITSGEPAWDDKEGRAGIVCGVFNFRTVALRLLQKSHILSTASEVDLFMNSSRREYARLKSEEDLRNGKTHVVTIEAVAPTAAKK
jgi:hypothetical protein